MYEVFINHHCLILSNSKPNNNDYIQYTHNSLFSWNAILQSFNGKKPLKLWVYTEDLEDAWTAFNSHFTSITAAGGLVQKGESFLFIYRNGKWDLPKGKLEKNEIISECAIREVEEECGIEDLTIIRKLMITYHVYTLGEKRILKDTHWYLMKSNYSFALTPQLEEGIERVEWKKESDIPKILKNSFSNIRRLMDSL